MAKRKKVKAKPAKIKTGVLIGMFSAMILFIVVASVVVFNVFIYAPVDLGYSTQAPSVGGSVSKFSLSNPSFDASYWGGYQYIPFLQKSNPTDWNCYNHGCDYRVLASGGSKFLKIAGPWTLGENGVWQQGNIKSQLTSDARASLQVIYKDADKMYSSGGYASLKVVVTAAGRDISTIDFRNAVTNLQGGKISYLGNGWYNYTNSSINIPKAASNVTVTLINPKDTNFNVYVDYVNLTF